METEKEETMSLVQANVERILHDDIFWTPSPVENSYYVSVLFAMVLEKIAGAEIVCEDGELPLWKRKATCELRDDPEIWKAARAMADCWLKQTGGKENNGRKD